jgi:uncharacterized membrane protein
MTRKTLILAYFILVVLILGFVLVIQNETPVIIPAEESDKYSDEFIYGEVQKVLPASSEDESQVLEIKIQSGEKDGKIISAPVSSMNTFNSYEIGDRVQVYGMTNMETLEVNYETADYYHKGGLKWVFFVFAFTAIIIAGRKGLTAILSVVISLLLFYFVFLKMIIAGYSPVLSCLLFVVMVTALTIPLIHGFNKKSLSAMLAILVGYVLSIFIAFFFEDMVQLGNAPDEEFRTLGIMYPDMALSGILIASIFMGAIGALIDTAVSISSAIFEAMEKHLKQTFWQVYKVGIEVGKDILGSMINTLLFAYLASILPFLILISLNENSTLTELVNMDFIALELTRTFIGAISLVLLIPVTASISAYYFTKIKK